MWGLRAGELDWEGKIWDLDALWAGQIPPQAPLVQNRPPCPLLPQHARASPLLPSLAANAGPLVQDSCL